VAFVNPLADRTVGGTTTVTLAGSGGSGGYTYRVAVDGVNVYTGTNATFSWNTTSVVNGSHALAAMVTDAAGLSATATRAVTVSNTVTSPPARGSLAVALTAPTAGATVSGTHWAVVWVSGAAGGSKVYTLSAAGQTVGSTTTTSTGPVSIPWNTAAVANGSQNLTATVRDAAGQTGSVSRAVTISNASSTPPNVPAPAPTTGTLRVAVTQPTAGATVGGTAWVVMWVEGASGSANAFTLSVDGVTVGTQTTSAAGPVSLPWNTTGASNGTHTLRATVRDAAGNTGSTSTSVTVRN
jgi:hypothetical protein